MTSSPDVAIAGLGAATPVGRTALASAAAVRAGISALGEHPFMVDAVGEPMRVAQCPWMASEPRLAGRITDCLVIAVRDALAPLLASEGGATLRRLLFVNLPSTRPALPETLVESIRVGLQQAFAGTFAGVEFKQQGHAGGLVALASAMRHLASDPALACIVAGADSYLDPDMLEWLEATDQLHGAGPRNNAWGFIPGEGAGAILVLADNMARRLGCRSLGRVASVGIGQETRLNRTGAVCLGHGLTKAFQGAFAALPAGSRVTDVYCDMNGEPYRADEFGFAVVRTREHFVSATDFVAPADCWGDVGAASGPLAVALACIAAAKAYANGSTSLVWASSDTGERAAALIDTAEA